MCMDLCEVANGLARRPGVKKNKNWKGRERRSGGRDLDEPMGMDMNRENLCINS